MLGCLLVSAQAQNQDTNATAEKLLHQDHQFEHAGDLEKAFQTYREAANQGSTFAMAEIYVCYWEGKGVAADRQKAMDWLKKSTDVNNPYAECLMGYRCETPECGEDVNHHLPKPDWQGALRWYRRSAEQNWAAGQYHLGMLYLEGRAVAVDEARGLELIRAASDQGLKSAVQELADLYACGIGEPRSDRDRPLALLASIQNWPALQFRYEHGLGTELDLVAAARYYSKIVLRGTWHYSPDDLIKKIEFTPPRDQQMGTSLLFPADGHVQILGPTGSGHGPSRDVLQMLSLYLKAARGDGLPPFRIGDFYLTGVNAPKSAPSAWAWFKVAGQNGYTPAREKIAGLEKQLTADEMQIARQRLAALTSDLQEVAAAIR